MKVSLSKSVTGLSKSIVYDIKTEQVITNLNKNSVYWTDENYSILFNHLKLETPDRLDQKFKGMIESLNMTSGSIKWTKMLGSKFIKTHLNSLIVKLNEVEKLTSDYYENILPQRLKLFSRLKDFYYDGARYDSLCYDHSKTVTGRTIVSSGLNIISMRKENRKLIKSKYENGAIIEIDLKSIEPRLYLSLIKGIEVDDAYKHILCDVLEYDESKIDRDKIKIALISSLYGARESKLKALSGLSIPDIRKIKNYLEIDKLKRKIENEFNEKGYFENAYGRKIFSANAPVNYYLQSTAVDYACLVFEQFMESLNLQKVDLIGVIVDAILLDVHPSCLDNILSVKMMREPIISITAHTSVVRHS